MAYNIRNFVFIIVVIVNFSTYAFAPWKKKPIVPSSDTLGTCVDWLHYHGFTENNFENQKSASLRAQQYDEEVSYFAAGYAYLLSNSSQLYNINNFGPSEFCERHTLSTVNYPYIALKDAEFTCEGWIDFYIYTNHRWRVDQHIIWANNRDRSMDNKISIWAALYFIHITSHGHYKEPKAYCIVMDKPVMKVPLPEMYTFMTLNGTKMSCIEWDDIRHSSALKKNVLAEKNSKPVTKLPFATLGPKKTCIEWITLCGFSDDKSINYQLVFSMSVHGNKVNSLAKDYIKHVIQCHKSYYANKYELKYQLQIQLLEQLDFDLIDELHFKIDNIGNVADTIMTPKEFCESSYFSDTDFLNYVGRS